MSQRDSPETVLVMNPQSGNGDHVDTVHEWADRLGLAVRETDHEGHAVELAQEATAAGTDQVVAVGGDGTLNEVLRGVMAAGGLDTVTVGVVPAGTGNDFAHNIGIETVQDAFEVLQDGQRRRLDLGLADDRPFLNSCVAGLTATASQETSQASKSRWGVLAYVLTTLRTAREFSGLELSATIPGEGDGKPVWEGAAAVVLVGNGRCFSMSGSKQANLEDGLLDVTIVEESGSADLAEDRLRERLFGTEGEHMTRLLASGLELSVADGPTSFSLDGEIYQFDTVTLTTRERAVRMPVGEGYDPSPRPE